ncbi:MAG: histidine kinase [Clostridiales bacterium]|jgi:LytS/YehU family sensor histidine kinase|nr:histidine kinase [Clostridiales bacterium]
MAGWPKPIAIFLAATAITGATPMPGIMQVENIGQITSVRNGSGAISDEAKIESLVAARVAPERNLAHNSKMSPISAEMCRLSICAAITGALIASFLRNILIIFGRNQNWGRADTLKRLTAAIHELEQAKEELEQANEEKRALEIKALETKINPHFLYNTLGAIRWKALDDGNKELCDAIDCMAQFYRLALGKGKEYITVGQEKELIEAYVAVQRLSFGNRVDFEMEVDEGLTLVEIPKMILQPLVENVYMHSGTAHGTIKCKVTVKRAGNALRIEVWDSGRGMDSKTLESLNSNQAFSEDRNVGVAYVRSSLKLHYGASARICFKSARGKGTTARIDMPVSRSAVKGVLAWRKRQAPAEALLGEYQT